MYSLSSQHKLFSWGYFVLLIILALILYKDYGLAWDEPTQRGIGLQAYNYIQHGDQAYLEMYDKIYGVGFELPMIYLEKIFNLRDTRDIFLFRHLFNVVFFAFGCFIFFRLNLKLFQQFKIAIIPALMLLFAPRIFGHAFFNSKDIPFLTMYIICFYTLCNYLMKPGYKNLFILGACSGLLINFRIMGVLFFATTLFLLIVYLIQKRTKQQMIHIVLFGFITALCLYVTWPYLWKNPLHNFMQSFWLMSKFPWIGTMLFRGEVIGPGEQLTNYLFTWIGITVPVLYLITSCTGMIAFLVQTLQKPLKIFDGPLKLMGWVFLVNIIIPLLSVLYFRSILYDDWRQLYFIYPGMIIFTGYLCYYLINTKPVLANIFLIVCMVYIGYIGIQMIRLHPYQHVYFNELVSHQPNYIQHHYDEDYWGTGFYEGLTYIAKTDPSDTITVFVFHSALIKNAMLLPEKDRKRFIFLQSNEKRCKYYLTNYRFDYPDLIGNAHYKKSYYEVRRQHSVILKVWKH